jgi:GH24 family phage-related lysozyme (muramidase)
LARWKPGTPSAAVDHSGLRIKRGLAGVARPQRVARGPVTRRLARTQAGGACCQLGWIDNAQRSSNAMSRRRIASSWLMDWPTLPGRN